MTAPEKFAVGLLDQLSERCAYFQVMLVVSSAIFTLSFFFLYFAHMYCID